jgi:hypothetical protein
MTPISTLPLAELAEMYDHAWLLKRAMQIKLDQNSALPTFLWQHLSTQVLKQRIKELEEDMAMLWKHMEAKITYTHMFQIKRITNDLRNH